jgi:hypothetical protein
MKPKDELPIDLANWDPDYGQIERALAYGGLRAVFTEILRQLEESFVIIGIPDFENLYEVYEAARELAGVKQ